MTGNTAEIEQIRDLVACPVTGTSANTRPCICGLAMPSCLLTGLLSLHFTNEHSIVSDCVRVCWLVDVLHVRILSPSLPLSVSLSLSLCFCFCLSLSLCLCLSLSLCLFLSLCLSVSVSVSLSLSLALSLSLRVYLCL